MKTEPACNGRLAPARQCLEEGVGISPRRRQEEPQPGRGALPAKNSFERLDYAEQWMRNGLEACDVPGFFICTDADMTRCRALLDEFRRRGVRCQYAHFFVRAAALALKRHPDLHEVVRGATRLRPSAVDIQLSVAGRSFLAPGIVIQDAERKSVCEIAAEVAAGVPRARAEQEHFFALLRRWGWLLPSAVLRRIWFRFLSRWYFFGRRDFGNFAVSYMEVVDSGAPLLSSTTGILTIGRVRDRVVAWEGRPAVRPMVTLTCAVDHRVWDGLRAARFLNEVKAVLESEDLAAELPVQAAAVREGSERG